MSYKDLATPYVIIGMHRSGTSFLTRVLQDSGIFMGINQSGVNEARFFLKKNVEILKANGLRYDRPGDLTDLTSIPFDEGRFNRRFLGLPFNLGVKRKVVKLKGDWGWKDPRNTLTLPYWLQYFPEMKVIHIYRNGLDVARSFHKRNSNLNKGNSYYSDKLNSSVEAMKLWEMYYHRSEKYKPLLGSRMITLKYEQLLVGNNEHIEQLEAFIGRDIRTYILEKSNSSRINNTNLEELKNVDAPLYQYASESDLMKYLGY